MSANMEKTFDILAPTRYPWQFNGPRHSRHNIAVRDFLPLNRISPKIEGITVLNPFPLRRFDLVHAFNRIPLGPTPFVIGFESHLPRAFGLEDSVFFRAMSQRLAGEKCRGIVAISEYARRQFLRQHRDRPWHDAIKARLTMRYPNMPLPPGPDMLPGEEGPARLVFIGNHFGRKGGPVALRLAERALEKKIDIELHIVSTLETGAASWVDPLRAGFFDRDFALLARLPNVRHHSGLPNAQVLDLVRGAHFTLLPTFSDSFGFSVIESMANYTPAIVTAQGALPEFVRDGENGIVLPLPTGEAGEWKHIAHGDRSSPAYESLFRDEIERLAEESLMRVEAALLAPAAYRIMRDRARLTAESLFCARAAGAYWDDFYEKALS